MKIGKVGTRVKIKAANKTLKCKLLEVDELGNYIIQLNNARQSIVQYDPKEVVVTHTFRTTVDRMDDNGDLRPVKVFRTATLKQRTFGSARYEWRENYMTRELFPGPDGRFCFKDA